MDQYRWPLLGLFRTWLSTTAVTTLDAHHDLDSTPKRTFRTPLRPGAIRLGQWNKRSVPTHSIWGTGNGPQCIVARRPHMRRGPSVGKGEAGVSRPPPPRCRSEVSSSHLPACGSRTGRPQPKLPRGEESRGVLDHEDLGAYKTLPGSATQADGENTPPAAYDCRCSSSA